MPLSRVTAEVLLRLGNDLRKDTTEQPCLAACQEHIDALEEFRDNMTLTLLEKTKIGVALGKAVKTFRRYNRKEGKQWESLLGRSERLISIWKKVAEESKAKGPGLPRDVSVYRSRLVKQKKELHKDPPVMPPPSIAIETKTYGEPKRDPKTGLLTFAPGGNKETNALLRDFHPNQTPEEVLCAGSFGGTYFRSIVSGVTNQNYDAKTVLAETVDSRWIEGLNVGTFLISQTYRAQVNKYSVKCGGSLDMWESSGWIADCDPYGWFQWYCRFYRGRRCDDDARQISRWCKLAGPKGRFRSQLCNKIVAASASPDDASISPVIRQTLLHWGLEINVHILQAHKRRK